MNMNSKIATIDSIDSEILAQDDDKIDDNNDGVFEDVDLELVQCDDDVENFDIDHYRLLNGTCQRSPADVRARLCPRVKNDLKCSKL